MKAEVQFGFIAVLFESELHFDLCALHQHLKFTHIKGFSDLNFGVRVLLIYYLLVAYTVIQPQIHLEDIISAAQLCDLSYRCAPKHRVDITLPLQYKYCV